MYMGKNWVYLAFWRFFPSFIVFFGPNMASPRSKVLDFTAFPPVAAVTMFSEKRAKR